jgi:hypothetical protein
MTGQRRGDPLGPELSNALAGIPLLQRRLTAAARPANGSLAAQDGHNLLGRIPFDLSLPALSIGLDHLACWYALPVQASRMPAFAHFTLIRTALESSTLVRWLLEPDTEAGRLARGARVQWEDYEQQHREQVTAGAPTARMGAWRPASQKQRELAEALTAAGLTMAEPITKTARFDRYLFPEEEITKRGGKRLGKLLYQVLSAPAHGHQWAAYQGVRWEQLDESAARSGTWTTRVEGDQGIAATITEIAVLGFSDALSDFERYGAAAVADDEPDTN